MGRKMTVNSYLTNLSNKAIIRDRERISIQKSVNYLQNKLDIYFGDEITRHFRFGSYDRGTILPRLMDQKSDVDYMVVFSSKDAKPQAYLNRLRRFVNRYYSSSNIAQSNPTIILTLNHIRFELVPAIDQFWSGLNIPARAGDFDDWIETDPTDFNDMLVDANQSNRNLIKPVVRLVKYWNAKNGYVFDSYFLEQKVVEYGFFFQKISGGQIKDYYFEFMKNLDVGYYAPAWKKDKIKRLHRIISLSERYEHEGYHAQAERIIKQLLPNVLLPAAV